MSSVFQEGTHFQLILKALRWRRNNCLVLLASNVTFALYATFYPSRQQEPALSRISARGQERTGTGKQVLDPRFYSQQNELGDSIKENWVLGWFPDEGNKLLCAALLPGGCPKGLNLLVY